MISRHRLLVGVLAAGALLRILAMVAHPPALFFSDSWAYLHSAWGQSGIDVAWDRPAGYAVAIKLLSAGAHVTGPLIGRASCRERVSVVV